MTAQPDHEFEVLEDDQTVPPRPEEQIADATAADDGEQTEDRPVGEPADAVVE